MKTIEEIMGLVSKQVDLKAALYIAGSIGAAKVISYAMKENMREIEAALRELVKRKPLSEDRIETLFKSTEIECLSSDDIEDAITFARLIEADHKIGA